MCDFPALFWVMARKFSKNSIVGTVLFISAKQIFVCLSYGIFDCAHAIRRYLRTGQLKFAERRSTFSYEKWDFLSGNSYYGNLFQISNAEVPYKSTYFPWAGVSAVVTSAKAL